MAEKKVTEKKVTEKKVTEKKAAEKKIKLEESFEQLNHILEELEKSDISLEDSFALYQEGVKLLKTCNDSIDKVEKELIILNESGETNEL